MHLNTCAFVFEIHIQIHFFFVNKFELFPMTCTFNKSQINYNILSLIHTNININK